MQSKHALMFAGLALSATVLTQTIPALAATPTSGFTKVRIAEHFDLATGQQPENIALEPRGAVDLNMSVARQVVRLYLDGRRQVLAQLPLPADGGVHTPLLGFPLITGLVRDDDGTLYFLYAAGTSDQTGLWRLRPGGTPERITALPANSLPNGLGLDPVRGELYSADSALSTVWRMPLSGGVATAWAAARNWRRGAPSAQTDSRFTRTRYGSPTRHSERSPGSRSVVMGPPARSRPRRPGFPGSTTSLSSPAATGSSPPSTARTRSRSSSRTVATPSRSPAGAGSKTRRRSPYAVTPSTSRPPPGPCARTRTSSSPGCRKAVTVT